MASGKNPMHYLVTGGCGFIGSHLVERLLNDGHAVTVIDDLSNGKRENIPAGATLLVESVTTPGIFDALTGKADGCFHLAAIASVQKSAEEWLETHKVNLGGTIALFDALARLNRKIPVVFASSAAVYGDCRDIPLKETASCVPLTAYGADKLAGEHHGYVASSVHGIPAIALRFFNVYGPRQDASSPYSGVISIFASRMKQHLPVTIYGDGQQTRDLIYVGDVVNALTLSMQKLESKKLTHAVFNICTGHQTSVNRLAQMIAAMTHTSSAITHAAPRPGDIRISLGDPALAKQSFGFNASTALEDGLKRTLKTSLLPLAGEG